VTSVQDFPDFTTPVQTLETTLQPSGYPDTLVPGETGTDIDTSGASSVALVLQPGFGSIGDRCALLMQWITGNLIVDEETITFHSENSYADLFANLMLQTPVRGQKLRLIYFCTAAVNLWIDARVSSRVIAETRLTRSVPAHGRNLANYNPTISAGASQTFYVPPVAGAVALEALYGIASGFLAVNGVTVPSGLVPSAVRMTVVATSATLGGVIPNFRAPLTGLEVVVTNSDAAAHAGSFVAWDVS